MSLHPHAMLTLAFQTDVASLTESMVNGVRLKCLETIRGKAQDNILLFASLIEELNECGHKAELLKSRPEDMLKILLENLKKDKANDKNIKVKDLGDGDIETLRARLPAVDKDADYIIGYLFAPRTSIAIAHTLLHVVGLDGTHCSEGVILSVYGLSSNSNVVVLAHG